MHLTFPTRGKIWGHWDILIQLIYDFLKQDGVTHLPPVADREAGSCDESSTSLLGIFFFYTADSETWSRCSIQSVCCMAGGPGLPAEVPDGRTMCVGSLGGYHGSQPRKLLDISLPSFHWAPGRNPQTLWFQQISAILFWILIKTFLNGENPSQPKLVQISVFGSNSC